MDDTTAALSARLEIAQLVAGYGILLDAGYGQHGDPDWSERFGLLWAEDATFETRPSLAVRSDMPLRGRDRIVAAFVDITSSYPHDHFVRHMATNLWIDELDAQAGTARARSALVAAGVFDFNELNVHRSGGYYDWFERTDDGWKIKRRVLVYDGPDGPGPRPDDWDV